MGPLWRHRSPPAPTPSEAGSSGTSKRSTRTAIRPGSARRRSSGSARTPFVASRADPYLHPMFWLALWKVRLGRAGRFRALGGSMEPVIPSGSHLTIEPIDRERIELGDIVMARLGTETMLHLVKAIDVEGRRVEIAGTRGPANGWTPFERVYGICTRIGDSVVPESEAK